MHGDWETFFLAQVGASAALTGLVFVALSINLSEIIKSPQLVGRAGEAVMLLVQPLIVGLIVLMPYSRSTRGVVITLAAGFAWVLVTRLLVRRNDEQRPPSERAYRVLSTQAAALPALIGGVVLIAGSSAGYGFLAFGAVVAIAVGIMDGWVLLVEILR